MNDPLVSTGWLAERLGQAGIAVLDATWFMPNAGRDARAEFEQAHIPGAAFFDIDAVADTTSGLPHMLPAPGTFAEAVSRLGVRAGDTVVAYDANGLMASARLWWMLRVMGHDQVAVLDGGLAKWRAEGRALDSGGAVPLPGQGVATGSFAAEFRPALLRGFDQVKADPARVVDARPAARFRGEAPEPRPGLKSGHMPGARSLPHARLLTPDGRLKPAAELTEVFDEAGVRIDEEVVASCGSGVTACIIALALARLGRWETPVYDGSWAEWGARDDAPVTSDPPARSETTRLVHAGDSPQARLGAAARIVAPVIQRASTVLLPDAASLYSDDQPTYGRMGLGVQAALEGALCELEGAQATQLFSSGAAAVTGALMSVLSAGDELLLTNGAYRPTRRLCNGVLKRFGVATRTFAPGASVDEVMALVGPRTRAIFLESPASLTFELQDIPAIARAARARGLLTLIDNTWGAGVLFKPLAAGVDVSIQALTKYASGGSDVFMGSAAVSSPALAQQLRHTVRDTGWAVSPDDCYTVLRSLRTLPLRLRRHGESALEIARWLETRPEVEQMLCPALPASPDHALWSRDFTGMNGLFGLVLRPAPQAAVDAFLNALELFGLGFSWGGFESLAIVCDPQIERAGRPFHAAGPVIRLHIGLEAPRDLIADLQRGLAAFSRACEVSA